MTAKGSEMTDNTGQPAYDRELIARMLGEYNSGLIGQFSRAAVEAQIELLRAADNRSAGGVSEDAEEDAYVIRRTCELLAHIAVIVNGPEPPLTRWSYHDLPEKVRALKDAQQATEAERDRLRSDIREIYDVIPMLPITAETADAATDVFTKFCIDFHQVLNAAAPDGAAGGG